MVVNVRPGVYAGEGRRHCALQLVRIRQVGHGGRDQLLPVVLGHWFLGVLAPLPTLVLPISLLELGRIPMVSINVNMYFVLVVKIN